MSVVPPPGRQKRIIANAANRYGLNPALLWGVYGAETNFGRNVSTSGAGAVGPFQFMPATARGMGIDPLNFRQAAFGAARYLSQYRGRGVAGMLAAYNAGPAGDPNNPETRAYIPRVQELARSWNGPEPSGGGGGGDRGGGRAVSGPLGLQTTSPDGSALTALLAGMRPERPQIQSAGIAPPAFSAAAPMPKGYQAPSVGGGGASSPSTSPLRDALQAIAATQPGSSRVVGGELVRAGGGSRAGAANIRGHAYPLAEQGKIIGVPYQGTHTLGNWQSDNAVDISVPNGTPVISVGNGVVEKVAGGYSGGASRFDGYQVTVRLANGNRVFYTHLSRAGVKAGQRLRNGQQIGRSGSANGVAHLHMGIEHGDPRRLVGRGKVVG